MKKKYLFPCIFFININEESLMIQISGSTSPEETDAKSINYEFKDLTLVDDNDKINSSVWQ